MELGNVVSTLDLKQDVSKSIAAKAIKFVIRCWHQITNFRDLWSAAAKVLTSALSCHRLMHITTVQSCPTCKRALFASGAECLLGVYTITSIVRIY